MADHTAIRKELEARLLELMSRATGIEEKLSNPGSRDWEENAVESEDDEVLSGLGDLTKNEIHEVKLALSLIESGHYGQCTGCGKAISRERMAALPHATTCIECA